MAEKNQPVTSRRREKQRRKGNVAKSPELVTSTVLFWGLSVSMLMIYQGTQGIVRWFTGGVNSFAVLADKSLDLTVLTGAVVRFILPGMLLLGILMLGNLVIAATVSWGLAGGVQLSTEALQFQGNRINPITGMARLFSADGWISMLLSLAKIAVGCIAFWLVFQGMSSEMVFLLQAEMQDAFRKLVSDWAVLSYTLAAVLASAAVGEAAFRRFRFEKQLKMSRQEVTDDSKESEGNPKVKQRFKSEHRKLSRQRMIAEVAQATMVVANPTHVAVALRYVRGKTRAPRVVAKGVDFMAQQIKKVARESGVPVLEQPPLAREIYRTTPLGREIPVSLYRSVAKLLAYINRMKKERHHA